MHKKSLVFFFFLLLSFPVFSSNFPISQAGGGIKEYLPGDMVHIIVSAPFDTRKIVATMPDNTEVSLVHDRRSNIWQGFWQVPLYFKKGNYFAQLKATDLENNVFEGQTNTFFIGELTMVTLISLPSNEAERKTREMEAKKLAAEAVILAQEAREKAARADALLKEEEPVPPKPKPKLRPKKIAEQKPKVKKTRKVNFVAAESPVDPNLTKAQTATTAHFYLEKQDYIKARQQLKTMLKTDPNNSEVKRLLNRVEIMIKIDKE